ncbi:trehalose-phosphatase [Gordonia westfalica]|uniref:Trehalose-phosphatase n=1 Tax=Gordonia westfalica TaxID=158898 RepID=A0ABU2GQ41_9ACTN|nr:trehalose-phosphatase [Gordonia westfalica]MDS1113586.1 trehalose-phosphatase [Gordonia westfalica]
MGSTRPITIDARLHDGVVFGLDTMHTEAESTLLESTGGLVHRLRGFGVACGVHSSRRDLPALLDAAGMGDVPALVGPADQSTLLRVSDAIGVSPQRCVAVEFGPAGVAAARRDGFALVIGVDGTAPADELRRHGADAVLEHPADIRTRLGGARISTMPDAVTYLEHLNAIAVARRPAVFLDFDGTLSEIVDDPAVATLVDGAREALARLSELCPVAIISGRDLPDIRQRVGMPGLWYAGCHGLELVGPNGEHRVNDVARESTSAVLAATADLRQRFADLPGVLIEPKQYSVAVHFRNADPALADDILAGARGIGAQHGLRALPGRMVLELRPDVEWDKGRAVDWILHQVGAADVESIPIYFGDDLPDEDAFDRVATDGLGVVVRADENRNRRTAAQFAVESPAAIPAVLGRIADLIAETVEPSTAWSLTYDHYDPAEEKLREALCTVGNGCFATRGAAPESVAGAIHYPGTYAAGVYNRLSDELPAGVVENESLVNLPNWLPLTFRIDDGDWFDIDAVEVLGFRQTLDLRRAVLIRDVRFRDPQGRTTRLRQRRFVSMDMPHVCALETTIHAEDWSGRVELSSVLDGDVANTGVDRYRELAGRHLTAHETTATAPDSVLLRVQTNQSRIEVALAARTTVWRGNEQVPAHRDLVSDQGRIGHLLTVDVAAREELVVEKVVMLYTSRDRSISEPGLAAADGLARLGRFHGLLADHARAWVRLWDLCRIDLDGHPVAQRAIRFHMLHMLQVVSHNTVDTDVGIPARGLHGEAYRGHIFWDEMYVLPVVTPRLPRLAEALLRYRFRRLDEARIAAREAGHRGAMFPWQSGSDGREESQKLHLNPRSGRWNPDPSARQHHVGLAVAYNVWQYFQITHDLDFLIGAGAEMLVEIARFWADLATYEHDRGRYVIRGVIGPDEFHAGYPEAPYDGIDNNAYTNVMAVWVIRRALDALATIPQRDRINLLVDLGLREPELELWRTLIRRMFVPFHDGTISQFEGYDELEELDWDAYRAKYGSIQRLDRILEAENDDVTRYKASKQADVLMLFYLLSAEELRELLEHLGYGLPAEMIPHTIDYYMARTSHGSTLSSVVHSWVLARADREHAVEFFEQVLDADITDIQGGTTSEGIHLAAMCGSIDLLQRCFSGLELRNDRLILNPRWPRSLGALSFRIYYRRHRLKLTVSGSGIEVTSEQRDVDPIDVQCRDLLVQLAPGRTVAFE